MNTLHTLLLPLLLVIPATDARSSAPAAADLPGIHRTLRNTTEASIVVGLTRYALVNARFEACVSHRVARSEGIYLKCITPTAEGWAVRVVTPLGVRMMEGVSHDALGTMLDGDCSYYDADGQLRAQGVYALGLKTGTWSRNDANGAPLVSKTYYGEDWEATQVRIGMATITSTCDPAAVIAEF